MADNEYNTVRINDPIFLEWNSNDVSNVNIYLTKSPSDEEANQYFITKSYQTVNNKNSYRWQVSGEDYDEYSKFEGPIYLVIAMADEYDFDILDMSYPFKIIIGE